jgi:copper chaperone CopZ
MTKTTISRFFMMMLAVTVLVVSSAFAKDAQVQFKTNAHCNDCKVKIQNGLKTMDGINSSSVDLKSKTVTIKYNADKTNPEAISKTIKSIGYEATSMTDKQMNSKDAGCCKDKSGCKDSKDSKTKTESKSKNG